MRIQLYYCTGILPNSTIHTNQNGEPYYSRLNENQEREYSFTTDFEDIWTDAEEQWVDQIENEKQISN